MNSFRITILLILTALLNTSCDRGDANIVIAEIRSNEELNLDFRENFEGDDTISILSKIGTFETYNCDQGSLRNTILKTNDNQILINIIGLDFPPADDCAGEDIAASEVNLGDLVQGQRYDLQISLLDEIKAIGSIERRSDRLKISFPEGAEANGIFVDSYDIKTVPNDAVWGFIDEATITNDSTAQLFINDLKSYGASVESIGKFGHFEVAQNGTVDIYDFEKRVATTSNLGFAIHFNGDFESLRDLVQTNYCNGDQRVRVFNTKGESIRCN